MKKTVIAMALTAFLACATLGCTVAPTVQEVTEVADTPNQQPDTASEMVVEDTVDTTVGMDVQVEEPIVEEPVTEEAVATPLKSGTIVDGQHDAAATVVLYDNQTIEVSDFTYDGRAPDTYIALGHFDENGVFVYEVWASEKFTEAAVGETFTLTVDDSVDLSQYTAVSIWCHAFSEDFGSAPLT